METKKQGFFNFISHPRFILGMLLLCLIIMVLFNIKSIPFSTMGLMRRANGLSVLDTRFTYSQTDVSFLFKALGEEGRKLYQVTHLSLDLIFPFAYSFLFAGAGFWLCKKIGFPYQHSKGLSLILLAAGVFDLLENLTVIILVSVFPKPMVGLVLASQLLTITKFGLFLINILVLIVLSILLLRNKQLQTKG